ncbi:MAG: hypothetical protein KDC79_12875 [Cyclobacteriaceae bacterium]|nr:hypothetical protein [Cyclobacteriaceae bacterium]
MKSTIITILLLGMLSVQIVFAQDKKAIERKGFVFGTSWGGSVSHLTFPNKKQTDFDVALDLKIGFMLNPRLALLLTSNVSIYDYSGYGRARKRDFGVLAPSVQYWLTDKVWVLGGAGLGGDNPVLFDLKDPANNELERKYYDGFGFIISTGYEVYRKKNFVVDIKARFTYRNVKIENEDTSGVSTAILVGINFY